MNYYSFHVGDYVLHTAHLSLLEDLAYRRLLDLYYTTEQPISLDVERVAKLIRMREHSEVVAEILSDFFLKSDDGYHSKRCDEEIAKYQAKADRARQANERRWHSDLDLKSDTKSDVKSAPNQEPITKNHISTPDGVDKAPASKSPRFDFLAALIELGVPEKVAADWMAVRKAKKAANTMTAINGVVREAGRAGISVEEAVRICAERGWQGFNAGWDWRPKQGAAAPQRRMTAAEMYMQQQYGNGGGNEPASAQNELDITGECRRVA